MAKSEFHRKIAVGTNSRVSMKGFVEATLWVRGQDLNL